MKARARRDTMGVMTRRNAIAAVAFPVALSAAAGGKRKTVKIAEFDDSGKRTGVAELEHVEKSESEWKVQLSPEQFQVARKAGTERAFTGKYAKHHDDGVYRCVCCGTALFDSRTKFESGTGWPSYWEPIARENVKEKSDHAFGMERVEVLCARCDGHLGHVFPDGPKPTGLRYCMNSASLNFVARKRG